MAFQLNPQLIRDALGRATQELPPLPSVIVRTLQLTENSDASTISEIEKLIRSDQAVSSKLLRVVNSAYFGLSGQVSSIGQAVVILGYAQVRNLVLSVSMMNQFSAIGPKAKDAQTRLWEHAFGTASAAQLIAKKMKLDAKDQELCFVGGLMSNIGSLFMLAALQRSYLSIWEEAENTQAWLSDVEALRLGTTHAEVGKELLTKWKLPEQLILMMGRQDGPFGGDPVGSLYAVHAGKRIARAAMMGVSDTTDCCGVDPDVANWLGWTPEEYAWALEEVRAKIQLAIDLIGGMTG